MLFETVRRARRRIFLNEALRQGAHAFSAALVSLIILLLLGSEIFSWPWLIAMPLAALTGGGYLAWRRLPGAYQAAQRVDRGLELADALSTALFFATARNGVVSADVCRAQRAEAERLAAGVDLRRAIPLRMPKSIYATAMLGLVASSLFALRYGLERRLDLRPPLARVLQQKLGIGQPPTLEARQNPEVHKPDTTHNAQRPEEQAAQDIPGELDAARDEALSTVGVPDVDNSKNGAKQAAQSEQAAGEKEGTQGAEAEDGNSNGNQTGEPRDATAGRQPSSSNGSERAGLLSKFRDAMSGLISRMRQPSGAAGNQQQTAAQNGRQAGNQEGQQNGQQGGQEGQDQRSEQQAGQPGNDAQNAQSAQAQSQRSGQAGQQPSTQQPGSGIGSQDGNKDVKLAEQLAAMGKISEIIGKRSANVTGELTVEVQNSNPQLSTPYSQRAAHHSEAGGEISRDEVPVALQAYVQQYFEQVRKLPPDAPRPEARVRRRSESQKSPTF